MNLYVDGEPATTGKIADNDKSAPDEPVTIGCRRMDGGNTTHYFNGAIDEVAIYSRGLKEAEIKQDMKGVAAAVSHAGKLTTTWANIKMGF